MIQVRGERVYSENRLERKKQSDQRKQLVKGLIKASREKRVRKLERMPKYAEYGARKRHK